MCLKELNSMDLISKSRVIKVMFKKNKRLTTIKLNNNLDEILYIRKYIVQEIISNIGWGIISPKQMKSVKLKLV